MDTVPIRGRWRRREGVQAESCTHVLSLRSHPGSLSAVSARLHVAQGAEANPCDNPRGAFVSGILKTR